MLNTKSTILENWQGPKNADLPSRPICHIALKQTGINLDFHLEQFYRGTDISFHFFDSIDSLITICQRFPIDIIIIGSRSDMFADIELVRAIKENVFLCIIPVVLYHPDPPDNLIVAAYEHGAEAFLRGQWVDKLIAIRIRSVIERNRRDLAVNPSTRLPGPSLIEREINRQLQLKSEFAVGYADLDNFKAYNDYYGYARGDKVIDLTARIIKDVVFDLCRGGFVGHVAGDDFIIVIPISQVEEICANIIKVFDALIPYRYDDEDRERGNITTTNRRGEIEQFPILTISIAVLLNRNGTFTHPGEMSKMLADLKTITKRKNGSNYMIERRKKY